MVERLLDANTFLGVELQHSRDEIHALLVCVGHQFFAVTFFQFAQQLENFVSCAQLQAFYLKLVRGTSPHYYLLELIQGRTTSKQGLPSMHLSQQAAHAPNIDSLGVSARAYQNLGGSVPASGNILS